MVKIFLLVLLTGAIAGAQEDVAAQPNFRFPNTYQPTIEQCSKFLTFLLETINKGLKFEKYRMCNITSRVALVPRKRSEILQKFWSNCEVLGENPEEPANVTICLTKISFTSHGLPDITANIECEYDNYGLTVVTMNDLSKVNEDGSFNTKYSDQYIRML